MCYQIEEKIILLDAEVRCEASSLLLFQLPQKNLNLFKNEQRLGAQVKAKVSVNDRSYVNPSTVSTAQFD